MEQARLRPLGVGELLDRATHIAVRSFAVLAAILCVQVVPSVVLGTALSHESLGPASTKTMNLGWFGGTFSWAVQTASPGRVFVALTSELAIALLVPLVMGAVTTAASQAYLGHRPTFARSYAFAWKRYLRFFAIVLLSAAVALVAIGTVAMTLAVFATILAALIGAVFGAVPAFFIVTGSVLSATILAIVAGAALLCAQIAVFACVGESLGPIAAIMWTKSRMFARAHRPRTAAVVAVNGLLWCAFVVISTVAHSFGQTLPDQPFAIHTLEGAADLVLYVVIVCFTCVTYYDWRIRYDAFDLEHRLDQASAAAAAGAPS